MRVTTEIRGIPWITQWPGGGGTIAGGNRLTLDVPLPEAYPEAAHWLPTDALHEGSMAGWYAVRFDTPTTGIVGGLLKPTDEASAGTAYNGTYTADTPPR